MSNNILGLGYSGYGNIAGKPLMFIASDLSEVRGWITSQGTLTTSNSDAVGDRPARSRSVLEGALVSYLTPTTAKLVRELGWSWRAAYSQFQTGMVAIAANGHGYSSDAVYVERITVNVSNGQLATVSFHIKCFNYDRESNSQNTRNNRAYNAYNDPQNQVIPFYDCVLNVGGQPGTVTAYTVDINQNYVYKFLAESTIGPPPPGVVSAGILDIITTVTTIAEVGGDPDDITSLEFSWGGRVRTPNYTGPAFQFNIPSAYADSPIKLVGFGNMKELIAWSVGWKATSFPQQTF